MRSSQTRSEITLRANKSKHCEFKLDCVLIQDDTSIVGNLFVTSFSVCLGAAVWGCGTVDVWLAESSRRSWWRKEATSLLAYDVLYTRKLYELI